jgi:uncharacterized membrane protein YgaE (UPF0421/DUF939 family)
MSDGEKTEATRGVDTAAGLLLSALVGAALIYFGYFAPWEFGVWLFVCFALAALGRGRVKTRERKARTGGAISVPTCFKDFI